MIEVLAGENSLDISLERRKYYGFSAEPGDDYGIFLPPGISTYRGVIFLAPAEPYDTRGFASSIPRTSPPHSSVFNEIVAAERQRSLQLAEKHGLALMGADVSSIAEQGKVLTVLEQFAEDSGHPELAQAPLLVMGFSFGGCFAYEFARQNSDRTIGFMTQKGGCHNDWEAVLPVRVVPGYLFIGEMDSPKRASNITRLFEQNRAQGALWALAVEPGSAHIPICDDDLLTNWMDIVLESRLPETVSPGARVTLNALDEVSGWLGHQESFATAAYASYTDDKLQASWLPSRQTAQDWQAFVSDAIPEVKCPGSDVVE